MKLYRTLQGIFIENAGSFFSAGTNDWDELIANSGLHERVRISCEGASVAAPAAADILAPVVSQEVWAAGVTYYRSRSARIEESRDAGGVPFTIVSITLRDRSCSSRRLADA